MENGLEENQNECRKPVKKLVQESKGEMRQPKVMQTEMERSNLRDI